MTAPTSLAELRDDRAASLYPQRVLEPAETALVLFAAGFYGRQDAVWVAEAGAQATCVDTDQERLTAMEAVYPADWEFVKRDSFTYARTWRVAGRRWDVVSIDCPSNLFNRCADEIGLWCDVAKRAVILGTGQRTKVVAPDGWKVTETLRRSDYLGGVFWKVLERSW